MPVLHSSSYPGAPFYQFNPHMQTILPALIRNVKGIDYERERFILSDSDFVDLDWIDKGAKKLVLLSETELNTIRGNKIAMVFQDPMLRQKRQEQRGSPLNLKIKNKQLHSLHPMFHHQIHEQRKSRRNLKGKMVWLS